uniref:HTH cro/C1-type domain-containing protein n=1 Tax=viral metagenome TaxID=1070528 RepID=A0A6C0CYS4_9ZZZZ
MSDEQLFDHQDWKQIIINKKPKQKKEKINNKNQEYNKIKKIEEKADTDKLQHKKYTTEFRQQIIHKRTNEMKITQKQLANILNLPEKCIKDIESGKAIYNNNHCTRIMRLLKI